MPDPELQVEVGFSVYVPEIVARAMPFVTIVLAPVAVNVTPHAAGVLAS